MNSFPLISFLTILPALGTVFLWSRGRHMSAHGVQRTGYLFSGLSFLVVAILGLQFDTSSGELQAVERYDWIPTLGVEYAVGIDGLSLLMIGLTALLVPMSLRAADPTCARPHHFVALVLLLQTGLIGTFTTLNFFHWFLFWEISLIPAFFLIWTWGGPNRRSAALQFFVYTFVGSIGLLLAFLGLFAATGTFDFATLAEQARDGSLMSSLASNLAWADIPIRWIGLILFALAFLGVAVKVPLYPFHTWLPTTYSEAPTAVTILLTGLMSKMGVYALLRLIVPIFRDQMLLVATPLLFLAVLTIVLSAFAAYRQEDLKRVFAYSSINHLGYCFLGVFALVSGSAFDSSWNAEAAAAVNGVVLQMFNHGIVAGFIFYLVGRLEQRSQGVRGINDFGGLRERAPQFATALGVALFASLGLPGLNAFIGEFLIFKGAFALVKWAPAIATLGLLITAVFLLGVIQKVLTGPLNPKWQDFPDLNSGERSIVAPCLVIMLLVGLFPQLLIRFFNASTLRYLAQLGGLE